MKKIIAITMMAGILLVGSTIRANAETEDKINWEGNEMTYTMPAEDLPHEGTWLTWPHQYTYGAEYQREVEGIWVQMTQALHKSEKVHIVAYDKKEQARIEKLLTDDGVDMRQVNFVIAKSDDVWGRDTGPMFVFDEYNQLTIADFGFDGWGEKAVFENDDQIPAVVGRKKIFLSFPFPNLCLKEVRLS